MKYRILDYLNPVDLIKLDMNYKGNVIRTYCHYKMSKFKKLNWLNIYGIMVTSNIILNLVNRCNTCDQITRKHKEYCMNKSLWKQNLYGVLLLNYRFQRQDLSKCYRCRNRPIKPISKFQNIVEIVKSVSMYALIFYLSIEWVLLAIQSG